MQNFHCDACGHSVYFENTVCLYCGRALGFVPGLDRISALEPAGGNAWTVLAAAGARYRSCQNQTDVQACNWLIPDDDPQPLCAACRLNDIIPDLNRGDNRGRWREIEAAKRRLLYTLSRLRLPVVGKTDDPERGLAFRFLAADAADPGGPAVVTGHAGGTITVDVAEADGAHRERQRLEMKEPYRTVLGHLRHEIGHYYWERLVYSGGPLTPFRERFGDEREDYAAALQTYYQRGPTAGWEQRFISAYASAHPWEDWAETWAHYLHIVDTLETARAVGLDVNAAPAGAPAPDWGTTAGGQPSSFAQLIGSWPVLTFAVNSLNRSMGMPDLYPFVISAPVTEKLRFVHDLIADAGGAGQGGAGA